MHQLVIKVLNIIDARCNHEVYKSSFRDTRLTAYDQSVIEVINVWRYTSTTHTPSWSVAYLSMRYLHLYGQSDAAVTVYIEAMVSWGWVSRQL